VKRPNAERSELLRAIAALAGGTTQVDPAALEGLSVEELRGFRRAMEQAREGTFAAGSDIELSDTAWELFQEYAAETPLPAPPRAADAVVRGGTVGAAGQQDGVMVPGTDIELSDAAWQLLLDADRQRQGRR
jgi:hypothetical protein